MNASSTLRLRTSIIAGVFVIGFTLGSAITPRWGHRESAVASSRGGSVRSIQESRDQNLRNDDVSVQSSTESADATEDTATALARLARVRSPELRYRSFHEYGAALAKTADRAALLSAFKQVHAADDATEFIIGCLETLGARAPRDGLQLAESLPASPARAIALSEALNQLSATEPVVALAEAQRLLRGADRNNALMSIGQGWGRTNPVEGLTWALQSAEGNLRPQMVEAISAQWAMTDPQEALSHVQSAQMDPALRLLATSAIMGTWSQTDPARAVDQAAQSSATLGSTRPLEIAFLNWGSYAPRDAAAALLTRNDAQLSASVAPYIATQWASNEPNAAFTFAVNLTDPSVRAQTLSSILERWTEYAPQQALTAALQLPPNDGARDAAVNSALGQFLAGNPEDFHQLLQSMPSSLRTELAAREQTFREGTELAARPQ